MNETCDKVKLFRMHVSTWSIKDRVQLTCSSETATTIAEGSCCTKVGAGVRVCGGRGARRMRVAQEPAPVNGASAAVSGRLFLSMNGEFVTYASHALCHGRYGSCRCGPLLTWNVNRRLTNLCGVEVRMCTVSLLLQHGKLARWPDLPQHRNMSICERMNHRYAND